MAGRSLARPWLWELLKVPAIRAATVALTGSPYLSRWQRQMLRQLQLPHSLLSWQASLLKQQLQHQHQPLHVQKKERQQTCRRQGLPLSLTS